MIPNIGHFEEEFVQLALPEGLLKQGLVGPGRTRGNHDPVEPMFLDGFPYPLLGILRAGVEVLIGEHHAGEGTGVLHHLGDVHEAADIDPTVADEDADAWLPISDIQLLRVLLLHGQGTPGLRDNPRGERHSPTGLSHRLGNILRTLKGATGINSRP